MAPINSGSCGPRRKYLRRHKPSRSHSASPNSLGPRDTKLLTRTKVKLEVNDPTEFPELEHKHLELWRFLILPLSVLAGTCKYLHVQDLTRLSRASAELRRLFMSKASKPCWDAARWLQNIPEWKGVAEPRAAAFIFDDACQGQGCENSAWLRTFFVCKRYCPDCAAAYLLDWDSVVEKWPGVPREMFDQLPWTRKRSSNNDSGVEEGRFVLKEDVERLHRQCSKIEAEDEATTIRQLKKAWTESQRIAQWMETWTQGYEGRVWHVRNRRYTEFLQGLKKRWGWSLDKLPSVRDSSRFNALVRFVEDTPDLDRQVWIRARDVIEAILEEDTRRRTTSGPAPRPWSLTNTRSLALRQSDNAPTANSSGGRGDMVEAHPSAEGLY